MYEREIAILDMIRTTATKFAHYKEPNKRAEDMLRAALPEYTIRIKVFKNFNTPAYDLSVWGGGTPERQGIQYERRIHLTWHLGDGGPTWYDGLLYALDVADPQDSAERAHQEEQLIPVLTELEKVIADTRHEASVYIQNLPVPTSAKVRKEPHYWSSPLSATRKRFPLLFGRVSE